MPAKARRRENRDREPAPDSGDDPVFPRKRNHQQGSAVPGHAPDVHEGACIDRRETDDGDCHGDGCRCGDEAESAVANDIIAGEHTIEHLRCEDDRCEHAHHRELLRVADRAGDAGLVQKFQQRSVAAQGKDRRHDADQQHQPAASRPNKRASDAESDGQQSDVNAEQKRRAHSGIQAATPVPHHALHRDVAEDIGINQFGELRPRHTPCADEIKVERSRTRRRRVSTRPRLRAVRSGP